MKILITGAFGYIGRAVAKAFREKGHCVYGLVRKQHQADLILQDEILPVIGDLSQEETYSDILHEVEVVVHCGFSPLKNGPEIDAKLIDTVLKNFSSTPHSRSFIYTSGIWVYGSCGDRIVDESTPLNPVQKVIWRPSLEEKVIQASSAQLKTAVIRPGVVYGGVGGLTQLLFETSEKGAAPLIGDGSNHWPMIHLLDLAHAYVSVVEKEANRVILNVVDDSTVTLRELLDSIAHLTGKKEKMGAISLEQAEKQFGKLAEGLAIDLKVNNSRIKRLLDWKVHHAPFINEIDIYYSAWKACTKLNLY